MLSKFCVSYCVWSRSIGHCTHVYTVDMLCRLHRSCVHQCTCMSQRICKCKTMRSSTQVLRGVWLSIGLCEETGFQPSSELSTTNAWWAELWWKRVPDGWCCSTETPSAELCSCRRDKHVVAFCRTKICRTRNAGDWDADVVEVSRTVLTVCPGTYLGGGSHGSYGSTLWVDSIVFSTVTVYCSRPKWIQ